MMRAEDQAAAAGIEDFCFGGHVVTKHGGWHIGVHGNPVSPTQHIPRKLRVTEDKQADPRLAPLFEPLASLPGVGPAIAKRLKEAVGGERVLDLLFHLPERYAQRIRVDSPAEAPLDAEVILPALVTSFRAARSKLGRPYVEVRAEAGGKRLLIRYINGNLGWLQKLLPPGTERLFAGKVKVESGIYSMINPLSATGPEGLPELEPIWPLVKDLRLSHVAKAMAAALDRLPDIPGMAGRRAAAAGGLARLHRRAAGRATAGVAPPPPTRTRLAYDEALAGQLALALVRRRVRQRAGRALAGDGQLRAQALAAFGHPLTPSQAHALAEIDTDLAAPHRMLRLLQGDVGAGKTLVAVLAMLRAVEAGAQARADGADRAAGAAAYPHPVPALHPGRRAGGAAGRQRQGRPAPPGAGGLASGAVNIVVGTHALFQEGVAFRDLGLAVVDEQHRFGVAQRLMLAEKGDQADMLVMTATPIPAPCC